MNQTKLHVTDQKPHWSKALLWALTMGALFFIVYGTINNYTALNTHVPSLSFSWERHIPFVPELILPYMSIDILFVIAFFMCANHYELGALTKRIGLAVGISALGFLLFPLQFGFERPPVEGFNGALFQLLSLDLPYNQCPSLHISLAMILWDVFKQRLQGISKTIAGILFLLIALSTVLVYQHHVIDVIGGIIVGLMIMYLIPFNNELKPEYQAVTSQHRKMALVYFSAAFVFYLIAFMSSTLGNLSGNILCLLMLYPATSLMLVASAYLSGRSNFLQKNKGQISLSQQILFGPYLLGICWTWAYYRHKDHSYAQITPDLLLGRRLTMDEINKLTDSGVVAILDLAPEVKTRFPAKSLHYLHIPVLDFTSPSESQINEAMVFVQQHRAKGKIYIHCALGYLRSASMVVALLKRRGQSPQQAVQQVINARPLCKLMP